MPEDELTASNSSDTQSSHTPTGLFDNELQPGTVIGEFEVVRKLGSGGVSQVYLARQQPLDRLIALKVSTDTASEGATLAALEHDHIVPVFTERIVGRHRLLAMRYIPGITLSQLLIALNDRDRRTLTRSDLVELIEASAAGDATKLRERHAAQRTPNAPFEQAACHLILELAQALAYAHTQGVLHRDVKPDNVLLTQNARAMLFDFNVAVRTQQIDSSSSQVLGGTLAYMSPEHLAAFTGSESAKASDPIDAASDVYSLGIVFFELITGRRPFRVVDATDSSIGVARAILAARLGSQPVFAKKERRVSRAVQSIVKKCLAARRNDDAGSAASPDDSLRYQSASQLVDDLQQFLNRQPLTHAADPRWSARALRSVRKHPIRATVTIAMSIACILAANAWYVFRSVRFAERQVAAALATASLSPRGPNDDLDVAESAVVAQESLITFPDLNRRRGELYHDLGLILFGAGHYERGIIYFRKSIACSPKLAESYNNLGIGLFRLRRFHEALTALNQAIKLGYDGADVLANRGASRVATGDLDGARRDFNRALEIDPQSKSARRNLELLDKLDQSTAPPPR